MPHTERPRISKFPKKRAWCAVCGRRIWNAKKGIRLLDKDYHRSHLVEALEELNIHIELANMGLDQPPPTAA